MLTGVRTVEGRPESGRTVERGGRRLSFKGWRRSSVPPATGSGGLRSARRRGAPGVVVFTRRRSVAAKRRKSMLAAGALGSAPAQAARRKQKRRAARARGLGHAVHGGLASPFIGARTPRCLGCARQGGGAAAAASASSRWSDGPRRAWRAGAGRAFGLGPVGNDRFCFLFRK
jgi:hypothetical protein